MKKRTTKNDIDSSLLDDIQIIVAGSVKTVAFESINSIFLINKNKEVYRLEEIMKQ